MHLNTFSVLYDQKQHCTYLNNYENILTASEVVAMVVASSVEKMEPEDILVDKKKFYYIIFHTQSFLFQSIKKRVYQQS